MKRVLAVALCMTMMLCAALPAAASAESTADAGKTYTVEYIESDGFYRVTNPNGGKTLGYVSLDLIEEKDGEYTYAFKDMNKNGKLDPYEDWRLDAQERAEDLAGMLTVEQISGLMLYPIGEPGDGGAVAENTWTLLDTKYVRFLLSNQGTKENASIWNNTIQAHIEENDPFSIPVNISSDPRNTQNGGRITVYNDSDMSGWPGNLGLAATFDPKWTLLHGQIASKEYRAFGIGVGLSPQVDLATEPRWSRFAGTFGEGSLLSADLAAAYVHGFQSTWDGIGEDAVDLGWGSDSVITMIKHFPGDGAAESGREAHFNSGKYNVYPGDNIAEHYAVFDAAFHIEDSLTGGAAAVMPSYSIAIDSNGNPIGDGVGSGYSAYKMKTLLRDVLAFEGLICCDWAITSNTPWGVEDLTTLERHWFAIRNGLNMFGGSTASDMNAAAYEFGAQSQVSASTEMEEIYSEMDEIYFENGVQCLKITFLNGMFENPYVENASAEEVLTNMEFKELGFEAQKASVVMVKNAGGVISDNRGEKKTVYIPLKFTAASASGSASIGLSYGDEELLAEYVNVVTDEIGASADPENYSEADIVRRTDFTGVDFALYGTSGPSTSGYSSALVDLDGSDGSIDNGYYPISLQFGEYTADPAYVRETPLGLDSDEEIEWVAAGGEVGGSRYYGGKTALSDMQYVIDDLAALRERVGDLPIVLYLQLSNPAVLSEVEPYADAIVIGFAISQNAALEIISGSYEPSGLLPCQLPADMATVEQQMEDVAFDMECYVDAEGNTYDYAFGMNWSGVIHDWRVDTYGRGAYADSPYASK